MLPKCTFLAVLVTQIPVCFNKKKVCKGQHPYPPLSRKTANGRFFFNPHLHSSKRPFRSGKICQHFEGPVFEVENIGLALCQYVTATGFPPRPSQLFFNNGRVDRSIKNENDME